MEREHPIKSLWQTTRPFVYTIQYSKGKPTEIAIFALRAAARFPGIRSFKTTHCYETHLRPVHRTHAVRTYRGGRTGRLRQSAQWRNSERGRHRLLAAKGNRSGRKIPPEGRSSHAADRRRHLPAHENVGDDRCPIGRSGKPVGRAADGRSISNFPRRYGCSPDPAGKGTRFGNPGPRRNTRQNLQDRPAQSGRKTDRRPAQRRCRASLAAGMDGSIHRQRTPPHLPMAERYNGADGQSHRQGIDSPLRRFREQRRHVRILRRPAFHVEKQTRMALRLLRMGLRRRYAEGSENGHRSQDVYLCRSGHVRPDFGRGLQPLVRDEHARRARHAGRILPRCPEPNGLGLPG